MSVSPDGAKVYVTGESDSSVTVLDASTGRRLRVMQVSRRPRFMAFAPRGDWALASTEEGGTVHVIDVRRDSLLSTIVIGDRTTKPTGIAISPDGRWAYVANGRANQVSVLDMHDPDPDTRIAYLCLRIMDHGSRLALQRCAVHPSAKALAHSLELVDVFR